MAIRQPDDYDDCHGKIPDVARIPVPWLVKQEVFKVLSLHCSDTAKAWVNRNGSPDARDGNGLESF